MTQPEQTSERNEEDVIEIQPIQKESVEDELERKFGYPMKVLTRPEQTSERNEEDVRPSSKFNPFKKKV